MKELKLPFRLLADEKGEVAKKFGVYTEEYGGVAKRSVFLVDEKGKIAYLNAKYSVKDEADLETLLRAMKEERKGESGGGM